MILFYCFFLCKKRHNLYHTNYRTENEAVVKKLIGCRDALIKFYLTRLSDSVPSIFATHRNLQFMRASLVFHRPLQLSFHLVFSISSFASLFARLFTKCHSLVLKCVVCISVYIYQCILYQ